MRTDSYSVVIPAFNAERTIERAIRSALSQEPGPAEVIEGDDGSADSTAAVAESAGAHVLRLPKANGAVARNRAAQQATGDLLFFLDADDWWAPGKAQAHFQVWAERDPSFVYDVATKMNPKDQARGIMGLGPEGPVGWEAFLDWQTWASGSSFSVPAERYRSLGGFREELISQQDVDFWIRAANGFGPAWRIERSFTFYRLSPGGVSKQPRDVARNLDNLLAGWQFATDRQRGEFRTLMTLTAAGFSRFPRSLHYFALAGWPVWRLKFWRALARSLGARQES